MRNGLDRSILVFLVALTCSTFGASFAGQSVSDTNWPYYGGDAGGMRYSPLTEINSANVSKLKVAWILHTDDISDGRHGKQRSGFETTPILVDATLFFTTGFNRVMAIDPVNGKLKWSYDPKIDATWDYWRRSGESRRRNMA
jgi:quinoprotein glucose dehydrogenase